jgi:hypothetical protein
MPFGLVFIDDGGDVWTVDVRQVDPANSGRTLVFSRPSFVEPAEQRALDAVPECWPDCSDHELRALLDAARDSGA